jgi:Uma2 family endonuclease
MSPFTAEYVDGNFLERRGGDYTHGRFQGLLAAAIATRERERRFHTFVALTIRLRDECYRIPDVCVKALPYEKAPILTGPDLMIEVISPEDEVVEMLAKIGDYLAAGIPHIWVVDPYKRTLVEADQAGIRRVTTGKLTTPLVGEVDFAQLFEQLTEPAQ